MASSLGAIQSGLPFERSPFTAPAMNAPDEERGALVDYRGRSLVIPPTRADLQDLDSRASSIDSNFSWGQGSIMDTSMSIMDSQMDILSTRADMDTSPSDKWRRSLKLLIDKKVMARVIRGPLMVHVEPVGMPMPANGGSSSTLGSSSRVAAAAEAALLAQQQGLQLLQKQLSQHSSSVQKGLAFSKVFKTLRDMSTENYIDPSRLTKIREVGVGAFATVDVCWLASENDTPPAQVAVKRLRYEALRHKRDLERFFHEAATLRKIQHKYIASYVGVGNFSNEAIEQMGTNLVASEARKMLKSTFIVQEYVQGGALREIVIDQMMSGRRVYSDLQACTWMRQVAEGLAYLHSSQPKVMHRDLKLDNIMLREREGKVLEACLVDFGLSVFLPAGGSPRSSSSASRRSVKPKPLATTSMLGETKWQDLAHQIDDNISRTDTAMAHHRAPVTNIEGAEKHNLTGRTGSFMYMAPEVFKQQAYNEKADIFSLGCGMYEVFTRLLVSAVVVGPTGNPEAAKVYAHKVSQGYRRPLPKTMPAEVQQIITECWAQEPDQRPDAADIVKRLAALEESGTLASSGKAAGCCPCCIM